jgi:hypothetical protein
VACIWFQTLKRVRDEATRSDRPAGALNAETNARSSGLSIHGRVGRKVDNRTYHRKGMPAPGAGDSDPEKSRAPCQKKPFLCFAWTTARPAVPAVRPACQARRGGMWMKPAAIRPRMRVPVRGDINFGFFRFSTRYRPRPFAAHPCLETRRPVAGRTTGVPSRARSVIFLQASSGRALIEVENDPEKSRGDFERFLADHWCTDQVRRSRSYHLNRQRRCILHYSRMDRVREVCDARVSICSVFLSLESTPQNYGPAALWDKPEGRKTTRKGKDRSGPRQR